MEAFAVFLKCAADGASSWRPCPSWRWRWRASALEANGEPIDRRVAEGHVRRGGGGGGQARWRRMSSLWTGELLKAMSVMEALFVGGDLLEVASAGGSIGPLADVVPGEVGKFGGPVCRVEFPWRPGYAWWPCDGAEVGGLFVGGSLSAGGSRAISVCHVPGPVVAGWWRLVERESGGPCGVSNIQLGLGGNALRAFVYWRWRWRWRWR